jgi:lysozyme
MIDSVRALIADHENRRLRVYDDKTGSIISKGSTLVGHPTIGFGRALDVKGITAAEAGYLLDDDIAECTADLTALFGDLFLNAAPPRQAALIDMRFNLGATGFRGFRHMIAAINAGNWTMASIEAMAAHWIAEVGQKRAQDDGDLLRSGEWLTQELTS